MKPAPFVYLAPSSLGEAAAALREHAGSKVLGGGQSLVPMMNMRLAKPEALVDVNGIPELAGIRSNGQLRIGACTSMRTVLADVGVGERFPLIHEAVRHVGHPANRVRGTVGGSIAHADPAAELPAVALALGADVAVVGPDSERVIPADELFVTYYTTALEEDEILAEVRFPDRSPSVWGFGEVARRHGDFALAGVAFAAETDGDGAIESARLALFGVADRPLRAESAEASLVGKSIRDPAAAAAAAGLAPEGIDFAGDVHVSDTFRREAAVALVERVVGGAESTLEG